MFDVGLGFNAATGRYTAGEELSGGAGVFFVAAALALQRAGGGLFSLALSINGAPDGMPLGKTCK